MSRITAGFETLMRQGSVTAHEYLQEAISRIDQDLGKGYAKKNPVLVAGFIQAAALDCSSAIMTQQITDAIESHASATSSLGDGAVIADALKDVADAVMDTLYVRA